MTFPDWGWSIHVVFLIALSVLVSSAFCALISPAYLRWVRKFEPQSRILLLRVFITAPLLGGIALGLMASLPSLSHVSRLPLDHCHDPAGCFGGYNAHVVSNFEFSVVLLLVSLFVWALFKANKQKRRSDFINLKIKSASQGDQIKNVRVIDADSPVAFSVGLLRPFIVVSTGLMDQLSAIESKVVYAHEAAHVVNKDNLYKFIFALVANFHLPNIGKTFLDEHALSIELRADAYAAGQVRSPVVIAEAILSVQRIVQSHPLSGGGVLSHFSGSAIEQRIGFLLGNTRGIKLGNRSLVLSFFGVLCLMGLGAVPFHNLLENVISL